MFLDFTQLYLEFFITVLGIVILMVVGYLLFSRPTRIEEKPKKIKTKKMKTKKVKQIKPIKKAKKVKPTTPKEDSLKEDNSDHEESSTDDLYDSNDDEQENKLPIDQDVDQFKTTDSNEGDKQPLSNTDSLATETNKESPAVVDEGTENKPIDETVSDENETSVSKDDNNLGNEDDDEFIDDFDQVDQLIEKQRAVAKPKPLKPTVPAKKAIPKKKKVDLGRYHVLYKKEDNTWYVKREGNDRVVKTLETQREALAFATIKAINQKTTVVVHKRDGKIKKGTL